jgi:hypothetical protein
VAGSCSRLTDGGGGSGGGGGGGGGRSGAVPRGPVAAALARASNDSGTSGAKSICKKYIRHNE